MSPPKNNLVLIIVAYSLVVAVAVLLRVDLLKHRFQIDENWHLYPAAAADWSEFFAAIKLHTHPPLAFLPSWIVLSLGADSPAEARVGAMFFGILSVVLIGWVVSRLTKDRWSGLIAASLAAVLPTFVEISTEVRGYSLALVFMTAWILALARLESRMTSLLQHLITAALAFLALMTNYGVILSVTAGYAAAVLAYHGLLRQNYSLRLLLMLSVHVVAVATALTIMIWHAGFVGPALTYLNNYFYLGDFEIRSVVKYFVSSHLNLFRVHRGWSALLILVTGVGLAIYSGLRKESIRRLAFWLVGATLMADLCIWSLSLFRQYPYSPGRHGTFLILFIIITAAFGLGSIQRNSRHSGLIPVIALVIALIGWNQWRLPIIIRNDAENTFAFQELFNRARQSESGIVIEPNVLAGIFPVIYQQMGIKFFTAESYPARYAGLKLYPNIKDQPEVGILDCLRIEEKCWLIEYGILGLPQPNLTQPAGAIFSGETLTGSYEWLQVYARLFARK